MEESKVTVEGVPLPAFLRQQESVRKKEEAEKDFEDTVSTIAKSISMRPTCHYPMKNQKCGKGRTLTGEEVEKMEQKERARQIIEDKPGLPKGPWSMSPNKTNRLRTLLQFVAEKIYDGERFRIAALSNDDKALLATKVHPFYKGQAPYTTAVVHQDLKTLMDQRFLHNRKSALGLEYLLGPAPDKDEPKAAEPERAKPAEEPATRTEIVTEEVHKKVIIDVIVRIDIRPV